MNNKEAIEVLRNNYPSSNYTMLIEAVEKAIAALEAAELGARDEICPDSTVPCDYRRYTCIRGNVDNCTIAAGKLSGGFLTENDWPLKRESSLLDRYLPDETAHIS